MRSRTTPLHPVDLTDEQQELYQAIAGGPRAAGPFALVDAEGQLNGPFDALLRSPALGTAVQEVGVQLRYAGSLSDRERELVILAVAVLWRSDFEWYAHTAVVRAGELCTEEELSDLAAGRIPTGCSARERAILEATEELVEHKELGEVGHQRLVEAGLDEAERMELAVCVGYYGLLAGLMATFDVTAPE